MLDWLNLNWRDVLDIGLVAYIYYRLILLIKGTRAVPVMYGLVLVLVLYYASDVVGLYTLNWFLANFLGSIVLVIIILFQRDIRKALAEVGAGGLWRRAKVREKVIEEICAAALAMARVRIGALMVIELGVPLGEVVESGVEIEAAVSRELLMTIFFPDTPLHDGAVIIRGERIAAAGCILPLSPATDLARAYGTRHRAAIGVTEENDCLAVVVSEERGTVSIASGGEIIAGFPEGELVDRLKAMLNRKS
jgi:uncharacterized protein (TIGR00159 family)